MLAIKKKSDKAMKSVRNQTIRIQEIVIIKEGRLTIELYNVLNKYKKIPRFDEYKKVEESL